MSFTNSNDYLTGRKPVPTPAEADVTSVRFALTMATADLSLNTIGVIGVLPAGYVPFIALLDSDALAASALVLSIGIGNQYHRGAAGGTTVTADAANTLISTDAVDGGAAWATGITAAVAGGQVDLLSKAIARVQPVNYDRYVVAQVTTAAVTPVTGELGVTLSYRAAQ